MIDYLVGGVDIILKSIILHYAMLDDPLFPIYFIHSVKENTIVTSDCATWGGINDKGGLVRERDF